MLFLYHFQLKDEDDVKKHVERKNKEINEAQATLSRQGAPNLRATLRYISFLITYS